MVMDNNTVQPL